MIYQPDEPFLSRIPGRKTDVDEEIYHVLPVNQILYAFFIGQDGPHSRFAEIFRRNALRRGVYIRTNTELYLTSYRSLRNLENGLNPELFIYINQSTVVNISKIVEVGHREREVRVLPSDGSSEWLSVSRRHWRNVLKATGFPNRNH